MDRTNHTTARPAAGVAVVLAFAALAAVTIGACGGSGGTAEGTGRATVMATTPLLGDLVTRVGGDRVRVEVLIPRGADPHDFEPSAAQAARLRDATLVVANGLGLEERLGATLESAASDGTRVVELGPQLDPLQSPDTDEPDPHVWLDPDRMARAAALVADELARTTGLDRSGFETNAAAYAADARAAAVEAAAILDSVPVPQRLLVTNHDALEYFADRFGFRVVGTIIPGGSTLAEPSAADLRDLVASIRANGVTAIFSESTSSSKLADTLARELGTRIRIVELSTDTLGAPGSDTATYPGLITTTARLIADGLLGR